jgi:endoglucanase
VIGKKPIHVMTPDERTKAPLLEGLWVDVGAVNRTETIDAGIQLGDAITIDAGFTRLVGDRAAARAFDNRVGAWAVAEALRRVKILQPEAAVFAVATVQEEVGLRGAKTSAYGINPQIGIAVDVTFATDFPSMDKRLHPDVKLGGGPTILRGANANRKLADRLVEQAVEYKIPHQIEVYGGGTGTDANAMQVNRAGMITGLVGIPLRYMHTPCEIVSLSDADNAAELMARAAASVKPGESWIPGS